MAQAFFGSGQGANAAALVRPKVTHRRAFYFHSARVGEGFA